jgi:tetratricopeptide (TPR) repeat protein
VSAAERLCSVVVLCLCFGPVVASTTNTVDCQHKLYTGFDSRVKARVLGRLGPGRESVVGFDVVRGTPVVALPHRLVSFRKQRINLFVDDDIQGLVSDSSGSLILQVRDSGGSQHSVFKQLGAHGIQVDSKLTANVRGTLHGSGTKLFLEAISEGTQTTLLARRRDGAYTVMASLKGELRTVSWNNSGLAAVASNTALIWPAGSREIMALAADKGLDGTRDICLIGSDRAVLALNHSVLVLTQNNATVLVGMQARCAWDGTSLYLLDEESGLVWSVRGVEKLGTKIGDLAYAEQLIGSLPSSAPNDSRAALEAARSIGCNEVMRIRASTAPTTPTWPTTVSALLALANQLIDEGEYHKAAEAYERIVRTNKGNARAKAGLEKVQRAEAAEREITVRKETIRPVIEHAQQLMDDGKYDEAAKAYNHLLQTNKANAEAKAGLEEVQRAKAAEREIANARTTPSSSQLQSVAHAKQLMDEGKYDEAVEAYRRVLQTNKANADAKAGLEQVQRAQAAEREIANARTTTSNSQLLTTAHAKQLMDEGKYDEAAETYKQILQNDKNNARAKAGLDKVQRAQAAERRIASIRANPVQPQPRADRGRELVRAPSSPQLEANVDNGEANAENGASGAGPAVYGWCAGGITDRAIYTRVFAAHCPTFEGPSPMQQCQPWTIPFAQFISTRYGSKPPYPLCFALTATAQAEMSLQKDMESLRGKGQIDTVEWAPRDGNVNGSIPAAPPAVSRPVEQYWWCAGYYTTGMEANGNRVHAQTHYVITYTFAQTAGTAMYTDASRKFKEWMDTRIQGYDYATGDCYGPAYSQETAERGRQIRLNSTSSGFEQIRWSPE